MLSPGFFVALVDFFFQIRFWRASAASLSLLFTIYDSRFTAVLLFTIHDLRLTNRGSIYLQTLNLDRHRGHRHHSRLRRGVAGNLDAVPPLPSGKTFRHHHLATGH